MCESALRTCFNTYAEAATAKHRRKRMKKKVSSVLAVTRWVENRMVRISLPCAVSKPVRSTMPRQPLLGLLIGAVKGA